MKKEIDAKYIQIVTHQLMNAFGCKSVVHYIDEKTIVRATWHNKPNGRNNRETMIVTIGAPNYEERERIKKSRKQKDFPISGQILFKYWPKKKGVK